MGSAPSRPAAEVKAKRVRATRKKKNEAKNEPKNETNENELNLENVNTNKNKKNLNIQGSPGIQLKRIQDLVCDTTKKYEKMDDDDIVKLLKSIRRLSTPKKPE